MEKDFNLKQYDITRATIIRNASPGNLYKEGVLFEEDSTISDVGALIVSSRGKTGRSPTDKRIVKNPESQDNIWWGDINIPIDDRTFVINRERALDYLRICKRVYVVDGYAGWDPKYRIKVRVICSRPYHALFMHNMLIRPTAQELSEFGEPDYVIFNGGEFPANRYTSHMTSSTSIDVCFERNEFVILGTQYAGEMKKGVFTIMNYIMPLKNVLSMHCSANESANGTEGTLFFGLSGTGKTTLSADVHRKLIGDDEHGWTDDGVFNIEGGCYAKCIDLSAESEPEIFNAIKFGTVLENVVCDEENSHVDYTNVSITENTRASYPLEYIPNVKIPALGKHPTNVILLTCDAFGVLPPVSKLTPEQAMYHFISGYTAKVAGTEMGITEPKATFSACFGAAFMVWHPSKYAELLAHRILKHNADVWLVNTGWTGGSYGEGKRIALKQTRAIIDAIHDGSLKKAPSTKDPIFGLEIPTSCNGADNSILNPKETWSDKEAYDTKAKHLASLFKNNFVQFEEGSSKEIISAGPLV